MHSDLEPGGSLPRRSRGCLRTRASPRSRAASRLGGRQLSWQHANRAGGGRGSSGGGPGRRPPGAGRCNAGPQRPMGIGDAEGARHLASNCGDRGRGRELMYKLCGRLRNNCRPAGRGEGRTSKWCRPGPCCQGEGARTTPWERAPVEGQGHCSHPGHTPGGRRAFPEARGGRGAAGGEGEAGGARRGPRGPQRGPQQHPFVRAKP